MLRFLVLCLSLVAASANATPALDQYKAIAGVFPLNVKAGSLDAKTPAAIVDAIDGTWISADDALKDTTDVQASVDKACRQDAVPVRADNAFSFTMAHPGLSAQPIVQRFTAVGGRRFLATAPVSGIAPGLKDRPPQDYDVVSIATFNYEALLYRPGPDVLVIVQRDGRHRVWFRCAGTQ